MAESQSLKRVAYSPAEFAELFGKSQTWGYRQIYAGKVIAITKHGRILIPAKEVEKVLESAGIYSGPEVPKKGKAVKVLTPEQKSIWERFLASRRLPNGVRAAGSDGNAITSHVAAKWKTASTASSRRRIAQGWGEK